MKIYEYLLATFASETFALQPNREEKMTLVVLHNFKLLNLIEWR